MVSIIGGVDFSFGKDGIWNIFFFFFFLVFWVLVRWPIFRVNGKNILGYNWAPWTSLYSQSVCSIFLLGLKCKCSHI